MLRSHDKRLGLPYVPPEGMLGTQETRFSLTLKGSKIAQNQAVAGSGAGLLISPGHPLSVQLNILDSLMQGNTFGLDEGKRPAGYTATRDPRIIWANPEGNLGGAAFIRTWSGNTSVTVANSVLQGNQANAGGALYISTKCPKLTHGYPGMGFYPEEYKVPYGVHCAAAAGTVNVTITSNSRLENNTALAENEGSSPQAYGLNGGGGALKVVADTGNYGGCLLHQTIPSSMKMATALGIHWPSAKARRITLTCTLCCLFCTCRP